MPIQFWGECISTAAFLVNKVPSPILQQQSPYQVLFGSKLDYHSLKAFGYLAYATTLPSTRNKFTPWVIPLVFVGYPRGYQRYKLYNLETKQCLVSRDVVFHETNFPFQAVIPTQDISHFVDDMVIPLPVADNSSSDPPASDAMNTNNNHC